MNNSGVNTILLVVIVVLLIGGGVWWYETYGPGAQNTSQTTSGVQINLGTTQTSQYRIAI